ncbi:MAG: hypothetical protein R2839_08025 [Thermomicrobiales bacterium]
MRARTVVIDDVDASHATYRHDLSDRFGVETLAITASVIDRAAVHAMIGTITDRFGGLHISTTPGT